jgi:hypothetical protein
MTPTQALIPLRPIAPARGLPLAQSMSGFAACFDLRIPKPLIPIAKNHAKPHQIGLDWVSNRVVLLCKYIIFFHLFK